MLLLIEVQCRFCIKFDTLNIEETIIEKALTPISSAIIAMYYNGKPLGSIQGGMLLVNQSSYKNSANQIFHFYPVSLLTDQYHYLFYINPIHLLRNVFLNEQFNPFFLVGFIIMQF